MGYDVWFTICTGGEQPARIETPHLNHTSNCFRMWDLAMPELNLRDMGGRQAATVLATLQSGICWMEQNEAACLPFQPPNGWGSYASALDFLRRVHACAQDHPKATIEVSA